MIETRYRTPFFILLLVFVSAVFTAMIRQFLITIVLAGIFSALTYPLYMRLLALFRGRAFLASSCTLLILMLVIIAPLLGFLGMLVSEAIQVSDSAGPWIQKQMETPRDIPGILDKIPGIRGLKPYNEEILTRLGQLASEIGNFVVNSLSIATKRTVIFFFHFFLLLYTMMFFFVDGKRLLDTTMRYLPLAQGDKARLVDKFVSVSRATIKGTFVIGFVQGALAGLAFAVAGISGAAFWGTIMTILSIIPGVGTALVWVPGVIYLISTGRTAAGILLAAFCALVVGTADNVLRPRLVGRDTKMHDLLILFSTLGGILLFGAVGIIIGPIVAALFVTMWEIYGANFETNGRD